MPMTVHGPALPVETCARRLAPLGATPAAPPSGNGDVAVDLDWGDTVPGPDCTITWHGPADLVPRRPGSEAAIQAMCRLMHLHGHDAGSPKRLGLEVASVAAGVLAASGAVAARIGWRRGNPVSAIQTSVLQAGLLLVSHYVAAATCSDDWVPAPPGPAPGPPFCSADGRWFEIETLDPEAWKAFWYALGAADAELGRAWAVFRARYYRASCMLPPGLHEATLRHPAAELVSIAAQCRVSLSLVHSYGEVLAELRPGAWHPVVSPISGDGQVDGDAPVEPASPGSLPLQGMRVVETTSRMQGPLAGLLLQMLGATVVKVEPPGGDFGRIVPPLAGETGSFFLCLNRGKERLELDLTSSAGRSDLVELVAGADAFLHNWRPGKAAEWGLEAADLARANPRLVYARASGWDDLPGTERLVGTDFLVQARAGTGDGLSPLPDEPVPSRVILVDLLGALVAGEGILHGLEQRERTGKGRQVRTSLYAGAMALQAHVLEALADGRELASRRAGRPVWGPLDTPIQTVDGLLVVALDGDDQLDHLRRLCGVSESASPGAGEQALADHLATEPAVDWELRLAEAGISCVAVPVDGDLAALPADPTLAGMFEPLADTSVAPASPWHFIA